MPRKRKKPRPPRNRVKLPLIQCAHPAPAGEELTPQRVAELLLGADEPSSVVGAYLVE
jgi:hypothetical protein